MKLRAPVALLLLLVWTAALQLAFAQEPLSQTSALGQCISEHLEEGLIDGLDFKPFILPAHSEAKYIGAIVETPKGPYFAMGHYDWTGHSSLIMEIERRTGGAGKLIWAGELQVENRASAPGFGQITALNETSKAFARRITHEAERKGAAARALLLLKRGFPKIVDPHARAIDFDESNTHLDPDLNFVQGDVRHDFGNSMAEFRGPLEFYFEDRSEIVPYDEMLKAWDHISRAMRYLSKKGYLTLTADERSMIQDVNQTHSWRDLTRLGDAKLMHLDQLLERVNKIRVQNNSRHEYPFIVHRIPTH